MRTSEEIARQIELVSGMVAKGAYEALPVLDTLRWVTGEEFVEPATIALSGGVK